MNLKGDYLNVCMWNTCESVYVCVCVCVCVCLCVCVRVFSSSPLAHLLVQPSEDSEPISTQMLRFGSCVCV